MANGVTVTIRNRQVMKGIVKAQAENMINAAKYFARVHSQRLSVPNPPPHRNSSAPGEYPRSRSGKLAASVYFWPSSAQPLLNAKKVMEVFIGYRKEAFYGGILERRMRRLGLQKTMESIGKQVAAFMSMRKRVSG